MAPAFLLNLAVNAMRKLLHDHLACKPDAVLGVVRQALHSIPGEVAAQPCAPIQTTCKHSRPSCPANTPDTSGNLWKMPADVRWLPDRIAICQSGSDPANPLESPDGHLGERWRCQRLNAGWLMSRHAATPFEEASAWQPRRPADPRHGMVMEAVGLRLPVGSACVIEIDEQHHVEAEVVGFSGECLYLMPVTNVHGLVPGTPVSALISHHPPQYEQYHGVPQNANGPFGRQVPVGASLLGRILTRWADRWMDRARFILTRITRCTPNQSTRWTVPCARCAGRWRQGHQWLADGWPWPASGPVCRLWWVRVYFGMMARFTKADVVVVGLIGERGREKSGFHRKYSGEDGLACSVVVAALRTRRR